MFHVAIVVLFSSSEAAIKHLRCLCDISAGRTLRLHKRWIYGKVVLCD